MPTDRDEQPLMQAALAEARRGLGTTSPNPAVGAVLVHAGRVVARGFHQRAGEPHAEIECLRKFGRSVPRDATLYVTLEPCSTVGRTGACTEAIIRSGVRNIVIGAVDPNPRHAGRGVELLRAGGVDVRTGVLAAECTALNEAYNKWIQTRRPFVIAKCGMTLDGRLTKPPGEGHFITSRAARQHAHRLRASVDAILVGAETIRADNPRLTVRGIRGAKQPWRIVLSRSGRLPRRANVFTDRFSDRTVVFRKKSLRAALHALGKKEITSVLIEGGGDVLGHALDARLIDKVQIYIAPLFTGGRVAAFAGHGKGLSQLAVRLERPNFVAIEQDICITGYPAYPNQARNNPRNSSSGALLNDQNLKLGVIK